MDNRQTQLRQSAHDLRNEMGLPHLDEVQLALSGEHPRFWFYVGHALTGIISKLGIALTSGEKVDRMQYAIDQAQVCCRMESEHLAAYRPGDNAGPQQSKEAPLNGS